METHGNRHFPSKKGLLVELARASVITVNKGIIVIHTGDFDTTLNAYRFICIGIEV